MFSDEKHLSTIITSISGKSSKKALIEPKTLFNRQLVPFSDQFFPAKILSINRFNYYTKHWPQLFTQLIKNFN